MIDLAERLPTWLLHSLAGGGVVLLVAAVVMGVVREPARRRLVGGWAVRAALLVPLLALGPSWLTVPLPAAVPPGPPSPPQVPVAEPAAVAGPPASWPMFAIVVPPKHDSTGAVLVPEPAPTAAVPEPVSRWSRLSWGEVALAAYGVGVTAMLARWLLGVVAFGRLVRRARRPDAALARLFADQAAEVGVPAQLRIAPRLRVPVCGGLWRPTVLLPAELARTADHNGLRWVFAHELAHLKRGDAWTALWFGLGQAVYFPLPWFWWLRRQVGLCQEYLADAAAARLAGRAEDYADFLVTLSRAVARPARCPGAATAVLGNSSDLFRRVTMLLKSDRTLEGRCPRRWTLAAVGGFLALAVLLAGVGIGHKAALADEPKDAPKKSADADQPKKDDAKPDDRKDDGDKPAPKKPAARVPAARVPFPPGEVPDQDELYRQMQKMMEEMAQRMQQRMPGAMVVPFGPGGRFGGFGPRSQGRLGVMTEKPSDVLVEQLDLPKGQGIVIAEVKADSAAARAGLKANDILMELAGKPVSSDPTEFRKQVGEIKSDTPVDAVVLRKGKKETVKGMSLPEAKPERGGVGGDFEFPNFPVPPGVPGAPGVAPRVEVIPVGPGGKSTSIQISNDVFSVHSVEDDLDIRVSGKVEDGKMTVQNVTIKDGADRVNVDSLERVPEKYRADVEKLLKSVKVKK